MDGEPAPVVIPRDDPVAVALVLAVHGGDVDTVAGLLAEHPDLARASFAAPDGGTRARCTWRPTGPGTFPNGPEVVKVLTNAVGYGCWHVAWLLAARGARVGSLWEAAALGDRQKVDELLATVPPPAAADIDEAFWQACHGGQRRMAEYLLARGANVNATPDYADQTPLQVAVGADTQRQALADWLREHGGTGA